jgi:tetratricopeptide (TPR) repeat protein
MTTAESRRPRLRVYLSSTYQDLIEFRRKVAETLTKLGYEVIGMEGYVASDDRPVDKCIADVRAADIYIGIFAWRYGFVPPGHDHSITELEYRAASQAGKERLIFLTRDDALWPANQIERDAEPQVERLRNELRLAHIVEFFATANELATSVVTAVTTVADQRLQAAVETLRSQQAAADLRRGRELRPVVNLPPLEVARFIDRVDERETLRGFLDRDDVRLVKVVGRGGMGKSALVCCVLGELEERLVSRSAGDAELAEGIVYLSGRSTGLSLERIHADASRLLAQEEAERLAEAWASRDATVEQKVDTLLAVLRSGRYVVLLDAIDVVVDDDLTIQEAGLRAFIEACVRQSGAPLLVVTSRVDLLVPPEALQSVRVVKLDHGLEREDACALLRELDPQGELGLRDAPHQLLDRVAVLTGGIPRALEVLAGILQRDPTASLQGLLADEDALGEQTVEDLVAEGYRRLGIDERTVMQALAVFRAPVATAAVIYLLHPWFPGIDVGACLRRLVSSYFVTASRPTGQLALQPLDREHAYREIPDRGVPGYGRVALELRAADFFASIRKPPERWLALDDVDPQLSEFAHCLRAGAFDRAAEVLQPIDEHHLALWGHYLRLIDLRTALLDKPLRADLRAANLAGLAACHQVLGHYETAVAEYEQAVNIVEEEGADGARIRYVGNLGRVHRNLGNMDRAVVCLQQALQFYEAQGDRSGMAVWADRLALGYWHLGQLEDATELAQRSLALAREVGDGRTEAAVLGNLGLMYQTAGQAEAARSSFEASVDRSQEVGDRRGEAISLGRLGTALLADHEVEQAIEAHDAALVIAEALGERREQSYQLLGLGRAHAAAGDVRRGAEHLRAARGLDLPETSCAAAVDLALVLLRAGGRATAADAFDDAVARCRRRLARCDRLFATRYDLGTALVGKAVCSVAWAEEERRADLLAPAANEYRLALSACSGRGVVAATLADLDELCAAGAEGLAPVTVLLEQALSKTPTP